jgi:hypothetical protein
MQSQIEKPSQKMGARCVGLSAVMLASLLTVGCGAMNPYDSTTDTKAPAKTELRFMNTGTFNNDLSNSLRAKPAVVTVNMVAPFTANNIPEPIDKWLSAVSKHEGKVDAKPDPDYPATRGILITPFDLLTHLYDWTKEVFVYRSAENYDVSVLYKPGSGEVTKLVFTQKDSVK